MKTLTLNFGIAVLWLKQGTVETKRRHLFTLQMNADVLMDWCWTLRDIVTLVLRTVIACMMSGLL